MKTPKPEKLSSGRWRVRIQIDGQRYSCLGDTKEEARQKAKEVFAGAQMEKKVPLTVGKAMDRYIEEKAGTLSPSTIRGYKAIRRNYLQGIMDINITDLTQGDIQLAVSSEAAKGKSPKTIRNANGLLTSVLEEFRPNFVTHTRLPEKQKNEMRIFSEEEMQKVWNVAKGNKYELPILFASWLGLRMSEVRGVKFSDVQNGRIHIHRAIVRNDEGSHVEKGPKTSAGDRWIKLPETIANLIEFTYNERYGDDKELGKDDYICPWADITIHKNFKNICKKAGVEACRFHDLRHFAASEAHALGVPNKYAMKRMGHKTENMLQNVYQHTMSEKEDAFGELIDTQMEKLYNG